MSEPQKKPTETHFTSEDSPLVIIDGPGDTTRRPLRPNIPRDWPPRQPPQPPADQKTPPEEPPKT